jgi:hypothetical protein
MFPSYTSLHHISPSLSLIPLQLGLSVPLLSSLSACLSSEPLLNRPGLALQAGYLWATEEGTSHTPLRCQRSPCLPFPLTYLFCLCAHPLTSVHPSIYPLTHPSTYPHICPSIHPPTHTSVHPSIHLPTHLSIHASIHPSTCALVHLSICLPSISPSIHPSTHLPTYSSTYSSTHLSTPSPSQPRTHKFMHSSTNLSTHSYTLSLLSLHPPNII